MMVSEPPPCGGVDLPRAAEKALRPLERLGVQTAGERPAGALLDRVVRPRQAGERVHDQHDVLTQLDPPAGALERELRHRHVLLRRIVEARRDHLADAHRLHLEDFLGPLVHQQDEQAGLGIVRADSLGDGLEHHRLARLGRGDDQGALALAERAEDVDHAVGEVGLALADQLALEAELLVGMDRAEAG